MDKTGEKKAKGVFFKNLKSEFNKILWPTKETVKKETIAVVLSTVALSAIVAVLDAVIKIGIGFIQGIGL